MRTPSVSRAFCLLTLLGAGLASRIWAAPVIDNNAGSWQDAYNDSLGISSQLQTALNGSAGVVQLEPGQSSGTFTTVRIKPSGFDAWGTVTLDGAWSAAGDVTVTILDSANGDAVISGPVSYAGPMSLASLSAATYPELKVRVALTQGAVSPAVTSLRVTWNPLSVLLLDKQAPAQVSAGQSVVYRVRYSVSSVQAKDLVVWDRLPETAQGTMTYPQNFGQNDNPTFLSASAGGQYTASGLTVNGVTVPPNSVYWDLGTKPEGTTETLSFVVKSKNGTLNGSVLTNSASADASNAAAVATAPVTTVIQSVPAPALQKRGGAGIYPLSPTENYTQVNNVNCFTIRAENVFLGEGRETMYNTVVYDNLTGLTGKIDPDAGGVGIPVTNITPAGGTYIANYTPPAGGPSFPAVVWNVGTLAPGAVFNGSFCVKLLNVPAIPATGQYENVAYVDSTRTRAPVRNLTPLNRSLVVKWPLDDTPTGSFAKADNLDGVFEITAGKNDDYLTDDSQPASPLNPPLYAKPGGVVPYGLSVVNNGFVAMNDLVFLDKVPADTAFRSAWFTDPWLQANAVIFYSTTDTVDADTPPVYTYTSAPADLDVPGNSFWENYTANPPATPALVKWVAFYIPAINSRHLSDTAPGWVAGAPRSGVGYFDVTVSGTILNPDPCVDKEITNRGLFNAYSVTPLGGGAPVALSSPLSAVDDDPTMISTDKPVMAFNSRGVVLPAVLPEPGPVTYSVTVKNGGKAIAPNFQLEMKWPQVSVNGSMQYLSFAGVTPASISSFDPVNGTLVLNLGNLAPGQSVPVTLTAQVPAGLDYGQQLTFSSRASTAFPCSVADATDQASAVAQMIPQLVVQKNDVLDLIPSGGQLDYTLTLSNTGNAPSHGTVIVDRIPAEMVLTHATGPQGERVWFSQDDNLPPSFLTPSAPLSMATLTAKFSPGILNDGGTPGDPSDDIWTSPFGTLTHWVAWEMDLPGTGLYPVGQLNSVLVRVKNDLDGTGPGTAGSPPGAQIFNTTGVFSDELIQAIGNEVVTTVKDAPSILVQKTGPSVVTSGQTFAWTITYGNNSGTPDDVVTITDTLPAGVSLVSATHTWNAAALSNGAPAGNNGKPVPTSQTLNPDGTTTLEFAISGTAGYRGNGTDLAAGEGGELVLTVQAAPGIPSGSDLNNHVTGTAVNGTDVSVSSDDHVVLVRNAEIGVQKVGFPLLPVAGDTVNYSLTVNNTGLHAATGVVITDTLPAGLTFTPGSALVLTPGYTLGQPVVTGQTLTWSTAGGNALTRTGLAPGTLPAQSGDVVIQYRCTVNAGVPEATALSNTATVTTATPEDNTVPNTSVALVNTPHPDPAISKSGPVFINPGERFTWTLAYWNASRQGASNVYIVDTLPDYDADGQADVTFISQTAPAGVAVYYNAAAATSVPAFNPLNPLTNGWSAAPTSPVNHIAWRVGSLAGEAGPFPLTVVTDGIRPGASPLLPAGVALDNSVSIHTSDVDQNSGNNTDHHITRTPGNDVAITKTGSTEGSFPGLVPGAALSYTLTAENSGSQAAYGIEVIDTLPAILNQGTPLDNIQELSLTDSSGNPVAPLDASGTPIAGTVPVTRTVTGNTVRWFFGTTAPADALYYRKIGLPPGSRQTITLYTTISDAATNGAPVLNTASIVLHNQQDTDPAEVYLGNNSDDSATTVYLPDLTIRKSVRDLASGSDAWTEAGRLLEYKLDYNNLGYAAAENAVISEIVPAGTSLVAVNNPPGTTVTYSPGPGAAGASSFDVNLGTLPAPANIVGLPQNFTLGAASVVELANGKNGVGPGQFKNNYGIGVATAPVGDINGDGVPDLVLGNGLNDSAGIRSGGAWVVLLNADGTAQSLVELADGKNGIPGNSFQMWDEVGMAACGIGDLDGDGVPDIVLGAAMDSSVVPGGGGAWVILLKADGTAKSAVHLADGLNGIPSGSFHQDDGVGRSLTSLGDVDGDGVRDLALGTYSNSGSGGVWIILLNPDGTARSAVELVDGANGIPPGSFNPFDDAGLSLAALGDVNGDSVPDIFLAAHGSGPAYNGGGWVLLLNPDGTVLSAVALQDGINGIPSGAFPDGEEAGYSACALGDIDGDGVPDMAMSTSSGDYSGGAWVVLLHADGTAKSAVKLANGLNGIPDGSAAPGELIGNPLICPGDLDGDGVADLLLSAQYGSDGLDSSGGAWMVLLNRDGSAKGAIKLSNGNNGVPAGSFLGGDSAGAGLASPGDLNGDGLPDLILGAPENDDGGSANGAAWVILTGKSPAAPGQTPSMLDGEQVAGGQLAIELVTGAASSLTQLQNGANGIPVGSFHAGDYAGWSVAVIGDVDGNGIPDAVMGAPYNDDEVTNSGGAWVLLMNADGSVLDAVELANDRGGIPSGSFSGAALTGWSVAGLGDLDGDGVPEVMLGAPGLGTCGAWVILLNPDGTAKSAVHLASGENGVPPGAFSSGDYAGGAVANLGDVDGDGVTDVVLGAQYNSDGGSLAGGAWVVLLNMDGTAKSTVEIADGLNGIASGSFLPGNLVGNSVAAAGDVNGDGIPDLVLGAMHDGDGGTNAGGAWVLLLDADGTVLQATKLADGSAGIPVGSFLPGNEVGIAVMSPGDIDSDGVPDLVLGAHKRGPNLTEQGGVWVILLDSYGAAKTVLELANGLNGVPADAFATGEHAGASLSFCDIGSDGVPDLLLGTPNAHTNGYSNSGGVTVIRLQADGSAMSVVKLVNGRNGVLPDDIFQMNDRAGQSVTSLGDITGDGVPDILVGVPYADAGDLNTGGAVFMSLAEERLFTSGVLEKTFAADAGLQNWDRLLSVAGIPDGTSLTYSIGRVVDGQRVYDLGPAFTGIAGPLPAAGVDISSLSSQSIAVKVVFSSMSDQITPTVENLFATYSSSVWPSFTFTVRVDEPVPVGQTAVQNVAGISTSTPEIRLDNNAAAADIQVLLTDVAVTKEVDKAAALEGEEVTYTLNWSVKGPQDSINTVLTDTLPAGLTLVSASIMPDDVTGQVLTWNLGNQTVGSSGSITVTASIDSGTADQTLINAVTIANDRQETDYNNNDDSVPVVVSSLPNVYIGKTGPATADLGGLIVYTLVYGNNGNADSAATTVTDTLPAGLTFVSSVPAPDSTSGQSQSWTFPSLPSFSSGTITVTAQAGTSYVDLHGVTVVNHATISTTGAEVTLADNADQHGVTLLGQPASLGGTVWFDTDADGLQGAGEAGIPGVTVTLTGTDVYGSNVSLTVQTGADGGYTFSGLTPGNYTLTETQPSGYVSTTDVLGTVGASSSGTNTDPLDDVLSGVVLASGDHGVQYNFGETVTVSLGDLIWVDMNGDGLQSPGEPGLSGATVELFAADGTTPATDIDGAPVEAQTTGASGQYNFTNLAAGEYVVRVTPPAAYAPTVSGGDPDNNETADSNGELVPGGAYVQSQPVTLAPGGEPGNDGDGVNGNLSVDFGFFASAHLGNRVWLDENSNGLQDEGERGIANVIVRIYDAAGNLTGTTVTDTNGGWGMDLPPGSYFAVVDASTLPAGVTQTTLALAGGDFGNQDQTTGAGDYGYPMAVTSGGENLTGDFGYNFNPVADVTLGGNTAALGDRVWIDADGDGVQDPEETGMPDVELTLYTAGPDGLFGTTDDVAVSTATTDATGYYLFDDLPPDGYVVKITGGLPAGYTQTADPDHFGTTGATNDGQTTVPVVLAPGDVFLNADFGYQPGAAADNILGDRVWMDLNANGVQDAGEPGIPGVTVALIRDTNGNGVWDSGEPILATDTTDSAGIYHFSGLPDGKYLVWVNDTDNVLGGLVQTYDSNGLASANLSASTLDSAGTSAVPVSDSAQDFGYAPAGQTAGAGVIGDIVWLDADRDGVQDPGEGGIEGVIMGLYDSTGATLLATTSTDENGHYWFGGLDAAATYVVRVEAGNTAAGGVLEGMTGTWDPDSALTPDAMSTVDLAASGSDGANDTDGINNNSNPGQDFGYAAPSGATGTIGNLVWLDLDADGLYEPADGETPLAGVTVDLYRDLNGNGLLDPGEPRIGTAVTGSSLVTTMGDSGNYLFTGLPVADMGNGSGGSDYIVDVSDRAGVLSGYWHSQGQLTKSDFSQPDPFAFSLTAFNNVNLVPDFGYYKDPASVGNFVWFDTNGDGVQDTGEPGLKDVVVTLTITYPDTTVVTVRTTTDSTGHYQFGNLMLDENIRGAGGAGEPVYVITVDGPAGMLASPAGTGAPGKDSDDPAGTLVQPVQGHTDVSASSTDAVASYDFGFRKPSTFAEWQTVHDTEIGHTTNPGVDDGPADNPDGDAYTNLEEFAYCFPPDSGVNGCVLELVTNPDGTIDACMRQVPGIEVTYTLEYIASLSDSAPEGGGWTPVTTITPVYTSNGDGTVTACYHDLESIGALSGGQGFVRAVVQADLDGDSHFWDVSETSRSVALGWTARTVAQACETFSMPYLKCPVITAGVTGFSGGSLDLGGHLGGAELSTILDPAGCYYVEVLSGPYAGHRFDVDAAASTGTELVINAGSLTNTMVLPDLNKEQIAVRKYDTISGLFPEASYHAGSSASDSDYILTQENGVWVTYYLLDVLGTPRWVTVGQGLADQGGVCLNPGAGLYVHRRTGSVDVLLTGQVRQTGFALPLGTAYQLIPNPWPVDSTPVERAMTRTAGFTGGRATLTSDQLLLWNGDLVPNAGGYRTHFLLSTAAPPSGMNYWTQAGQVSVPNQNDTDLFLSTRSQLLHLINAKPDYVMPLPWLP